jgi:hypothetical protein
VKRDRSTRARGRVVELALLAAVVLSSCAGCDEDAETPTVPASEGETHVVSGIPVGTVEGVIRLAPGAEIPSYEVSPFATPNAGSLPESCTPPRVADRQPLALDDARGLANVAIGAMGDRTHWIAPGEPTVREIHIRDCRLDPPTIVATLGDRVRVFNEVDYPFMPQFGLGFLQAVTSAEPIETNLDQAGPRPLECALAAPCGRAEIMVFQTPVHAVSGAGGTFRIENAPAGQEITLVAWHPLIEEAQVTTRVEQGGTVHVEIVVRPHGSAAAPGPAPTEPTDEAPAETADAPADPAAPSAGPF